MTQGEPGGGQVWQWERRSSTPVSSQEREGGGRHLVSPGAEREGGEGAGGQVGQ